MHLRGVCIIRLVGLLAFAGTASLQAEESRAVANSSAAGSAAGHVAGPIRDPMNPQAYMSQLASKLNTTDSKGLLMKGVTVPAAKRAEPTQTKAVPTTPAPAPAAVPTAPQTPGIVPVTKSATVPIMVPVTAPAVAPATAPAGKTVPQVTPSPAPVAAEKRVPILSDMPKSPEPKKEPAPQVVCGERVERAVAGQPVR